MGIVTHKHKLKIERVSKKGKTIFFFCKECGVERGYKRWRVHYVLLSGRTRKGLRLFRKNKDRAN